MVELQPNNEKHDSDLMTMPFWPTQQLSDILSVKAKQMLLGFSGDAFQSRGFNCATWQTSGPGMALKRRQLYKTHLCGCGRGQEPTAKASTKDTKHLVRKGRDIRGYEEGNAGIPQKNH